MIFFCFLWSFGTHVFFVPQCITACAAVSARACSVTVNTGVPSACSEILNAGVPRCTAGQ